MPKKKCGFGFNCGSMMLQPGLEAGDCPNYKNCGGATELTEDEQVELIRVREEQYHQRNQEWQQIQERILITRREAAVMMLMSRAVPQTPESLGLVEILTRIVTKLAEVRVHLPNFDGLYIAPPQCEVHRYNVKRPKGTYWYNKLLAGASIFEPSERTEKVRTIHLSHDDDPRNEEARKGIERRNRLLQVRTRLKVIEQALAETLELLHEPEP